MYHENMCFNPFSTFNLKETKTMFKKYSLFLLLVLILPLTLAACGGGPSAEDTEEAMEDFFNNGNADQWNDIACDDNQISDEDADSYKALLDESEAIGAKIDINVTCEEDGEKMKCNYSFPGVSQDTEFDIDGGKLCGGDLTN